MLNISVVVGFVTVMVNWWNQQVQFNTTATILLAATLSEIQQRE